MAEELDLTKPEHAAGSTMAAFALAQMSFSTLVTNELIPKADKGRRRKNAEAVNQSQ
jgi:hypothetical protein